jgi:hypothetical protein
MANVLCRSCDQEKPIEEFTKSNLKHSWSASNNFKHSSIQQYHSYCKKCNAIKAKAFRAKYKADGGGSDYRGSGKLKKVPVEDRKLMSLIRGRITEAKGRTKKFNQVDLNIDEDYMYKMMNDQNRKCAVTGCEFVIEKQHPLCPSLDKIEPDKGYTKGNVQWLSWAANRAKGDLSSADFIEMCKRIVEVSERATTIPLGIRAKWLEAQNPS